MGAVRASTTLTAFLGLTVPLMPVQALLKRVWMPGARALPHWFHKRVCGVLGVRLWIDGELAKNRPLLVVANHTSWLDIPVLSAIGPVSFIAKREVGRWPFVSSLAKLQRTIFVDRDRRAAVSETTAEIMARFEEGDAVVLFAEGTSSDGNRVLPFMTSLFAAVKPAGKQGTVPDDVVVQTVSIVYTHLHGVPFGRADRHLVGWYGDMEMQGHAWELLKAGPLDVRIKIGAPIPLEEFSDRKDLARRSEHEIRENVVRILRGRSDTDPIDLVTVTPGQHGRPERRANPAGETDQKWR